MKYRKLTGPIYALVEAAAIDLFVGGAPCSLPALTERVAEKTGGELKKVRNSIMHALRQLGKRGHYVPQPTSSGPAKKGYGARTTPQAFNWSHSLTGHALEIAVLHYLEDPDVASAKKSAVRSALRVVLDLPTKCSDGKILTAAQRVHADMLWALPEQTFQRTLANRLEKQTAKNHRSAIRSLVRYAAMRRLVPLVFPEAPKESSWARLRDQYFPISVVGRLDNRSYRLRRAWNTLAKATEKLFGADVQLTDLTRERADQVVDDLLLKQRRGSDAYEVRSLLTHLAKHHGIGPYTGSSELACYEIDTPHGRRPRLYVRGPDDEAATDDWQGLIRILRRLGYPKSLTDFLTWYGRYVTIPALEVLENKHRFPVRWSRHHVSEKALSARIPAIRAILGIATQRLPLSSSKKCKYVGWGLTPSEVTPDVVFGERFEVSTPGENVPNVAGENVPPGRGCQALPSGHESLLSPA